ncbi:MAG: tol-pal system protein YbgF, partial [Cyclobacteriaceae bacterium]
MKSLVVLLVIAAVGTCAATPGHRPDNRDSTLILISNLDIQLEAAEALTNLYNFEFEKAETKFRYFKIKYGWHPLPYFLLGLSEWWKIMPNTKRTVYDDRFLAYMD